MIGLGLWTFFLFGLHGWCCFGFCLGFGLFGLYDLFLVCGIIVVIDYFCFLFFVAIRCLTCGLGDFGLLFELFVLALGLFDLIYCLLFMVDCLWFLFELIGFRLFLIESLMYFIVGGLGYLLCFL